MSVARIKPAAPALCVPRPFSEVRRCGITLIHHVQSKKGVMAGLDPANQYAHVCARGRHYFTAKNAKFL